MNSTATNQIAKHWGGGWGARPRSSTYGVEPSWEEQAFARDAAGYLGGGVWPPRSYSCSFCRREFRSAQALGGHMNVHRRDRARLRQASSDDVQDAHQLPHYPSLSATNHDQAHHHSALLYSALLSNSKEVMTSSPPPSYISNIIKESKNMVFVSRSEAQAEAIQCDDDDDDDNDEEAARRKRRRVARHPVVVLPFFVRPAAAAGCEREELRGAHDDAKVPKTVTSPSSSSFLAGQQEVDLELRLGNS